MTLRLLASRRHELVGLRTQAINRLHRKLQILIPGGAKRGLSDINAQIKAAVKAAPTRLPQLRGVGPVITATVIGEVRDVARFIDADHFASYNGTAPTTWGSAGEGRPCVNRGGNRRLNHAIHMAAVTQLRNPGPGRDYYLRKRDTGKKPKEALRCLKRRISDAIYRQLLADADAIERGPGGQMGATTKISAAGSTPNAGSSIKPQPGPHQKNAPAAAHAS